MSAFMMDRAEFLKIGAFVAAHTSRTPTHEQLFCYMPDREHNLNRYTPERVATVLMEQNAASINSRYGDEVLVETITYQNLQGVSDPTPGELAALLNCFSYQACETEDWRTCEARELTHALRKLALKVVAKAEGLEGWA